MKADIPVKELESLTDASSISKQVETILDQIKHLRTAVSTTIDKAKNKSSRKNAESEIELFLLLIFLSDFSNYQIATKYIFIFRLHI